MANKYEQMEAELENIKCKHCDGLGYYDDAEPGDISFNQWMCNQCNGTGIDEVNSCQCKNEHNMPLNKCDECPR